MEEFQKKYVLRHVAKAIIEYCNNHEFDLMHSGVGGDSFYFLLDNYRNEIEKEAYKGVKSKR